VGSEGGTAALTNVVFMGTPPPLIFPKSGEKVVTMKSIVTPVSDRGPLNPKPWCSYGSHALRMILLLRADVTWQRRSLSQAFRWIAG